MASADAATLETMVGICLLTQPELVAGVVIVIGAVVVAVAIKEELDAYELKRGRPEVGPVLETNPAPPEASAKQRPGPGPAGEDWPPPLPPEPGDERPECKPVPVPHLGGNGPHDECADKIPNNSFPGWDVLVNGKNFDALQLASRTLWDVKTDDFDRHSPRSQDFLARVKLPEIEREKVLAEACGYRFVVGVVSPAHKAALLALDPGLAVVVMDWC